METFRLTQGKQTPLQPHLPGGVSDHPNTEGCAPGPQGALNGAGHDKKDPDQGPPTAGPITPTGSGHTISYAPGRAVSFSHSPEPRIDSWYERAQNPSSKTKPVHHKNRNHRLNQNFWKANGNVSAPIIIAISQIMGRILHPPGGGAKFRSGSGPAVSGLPDPPQDRPLPRLRCDEGSDQSKGKVPGALAHMLPPRQGRAQRDQGLGGAGGGDVASCRYRRPCGPKSPGRPGWGLGSRKSVR